VQAAQALKGVVKVGAVDMDAHQSVGAPYGVKGFPTIKIFGANKAAPQDYQQARDANSIVGAGLRAVSDLVQGRMGGGGSSGGGGGASKVVQLNDGNFDEKVVKSKEPVLVAVVAPWCGHCKALIPNWDAAAAEMDGKPVHVGLVDATASAGLAQKYKVEGYPSIKIFKNGTPEDYTGGFQ
jgi:protein disulfide-isomerase A6